MQELLGLTPLLGNSVHTMHFMQNQDFTAIRVAVADRLHLIQIKHGKWLLTDSQQFTEQVDVKQVQIVSSTTVIVDARHILKLPEMKVEEYPSLPLYHPDNLRTIFCKGYLAQVIQILLDLHNYLKDPRGN